MLWDHGYVTVRVSLCVFAEMGYAELPQKHRLHVQTSLDLGQRSTVERRSTSSSFCYLIGLRTLRSCKAIRFCLYLVLVCRREEEHWVERHFCRFTGTFQEAAIESSNENNSLEATLVDQVRF